MIQPRLGKIRAQLKGTGEKQIFASSIERLFEKSRAQRDSNSCPSQPKHDALPHDTFPTPESHLASFSLLEAETVKWRECKSLSATYPAQFEKFLCSVSNSKDAKCSKAWRRRRRIKEQKTRNWTPRSIPVENNMWCFLAKIRQIRSYRIASA